MPGKGSTATKAELIDSLRRLASDVEGKPSIHNMDEDGAWSHTPYLNEFGSWNDALRASGLPPRNPNEEEIIIDIKELSEQLGHPPSSFEYRKHGTWSPKVVLTRFGEWKSAVRAAGMTPRATQIHEYSPAEALAELERVNDESDRPLHSKDINKDPDAPCIQTLINIFGSVDDAVRKSNIDVYRFYDPTDRELIEDIRRVSNDGEPPTITEYNAADGGLYSYSKIESRFGSWTQGVIEAGFQPTDTSRTALIPEDELLAELKTLEDRVGGIPGYEDMADKGEHSPTTYEAHFGSWLNALSQAGYPIEERLGKARPPIGLNQREMSKFVSNINDFDSQLIRLTCLFLLFMGTSPRVYANLTKDQLMQPDGSNDLFIDIPEDSPNEDRTVQVPNTWQNPLTGEREVHHLKDLIEWYFEKPYTDAVGLHKVTPTVQIHRAAKMADIEWQNTVIIAGTEYPDLQARDLRETHGVHLARNGAAPWQIQRRLGLESEKDAEHYIEQIE